MHGIKNKYTGKTVKKKIYIYILYKQENGFYVECGALDGEKGSNTFFFEKVRKWNGVLIEADPSNFAVLKTKHRKAFISHSCLSPTRIPAKVIFLYPQPRHQLS